MIYQIPYQVYEFNGKLIDRQTYENLKSAFDANPYLDFPEPKSYFQEHRSESMMVLVPFMICLVLVPFGEMIDGTFLMLVLAISFIFLLFGVIFQISQFRSFQKARRKQRKFFNNLKQDIIASENYQDLVSLQRKRKIQYV
ncbi:hypothetical protein [Zobellia uliginosa]|uniref:hypothetical protein n=1 Tax=Zobellia uliginosa TaxID=143224 RepID=UPI001C06A15F|nr:hypothetical protein [Zobellia uliginosa]MBU2947026.1 hypothetical protein [Zobellia uliginosa]